MSIKLIKFPHEICLYTAWDKLVISFPKDCCAGDCSIKIDGHGVDKIIDLSELKKQMEESSECEHESEISPIIDEME